MAAYYNEFDKKTAKWLRELIRRDLIAPGDVDDRPIQEVQPKDLDGYGQCHFFAGIGGWSYALRLAGVADDAAVWTGSCPCQPFSSAGKRKGFADERHLWPEFYRLIAECRPAIAFGEQVAGRAGLQWLVGVFADLEASGYACAAADLPAACVGAPHKRQRLFWVADGESSRRKARRTVAVRNGLPHESSSAIAHGRESVELGDNSSTRPQKQRREYRPSGQRCRGFVGFAVQAGVPEWNGPTVAVECSDGYRRISSQPDAFPVAHGVPARVVKLRGSGNAIVPQVAAEFIRAAI